MLNTANLGNNIALLETSIASIEIVRSSIEASLKQSRDALVVLKSLHAIAKQVDPVLLEPIDDLDLSLRARLALKAKNIFYLGDLVQLSEGDLLKVPKLGKRSIGEIKEVLMSRKLNPGTPLPNWEYNTSSIASGPSTADSQLLPIFSKSINILELPTRLENYLKIGRVTYIGDLVQIRIKDICKIRGIGRESRDTIMNRLMIQGLSLGMDLPNWQPKG